MATEQVRAEDLDYSAILWREEGIWNAIQVPARQALVLDDLLALCKQYPGEGGVYAVVGVSDEFFVYCVTILESGSFHQRRTGAFGLGSCRRRSRPH